MTMESGDEIHIEQRKPEEVTEMWYEKRMAPEGVGVVNPAFDDRPQLCHRHHHREGHRLSR